MSLLLACVTKIDYFCDKTRRQMKSIHQKVIDQVRKFERGSILFPEQFEHLGSNEAVRQSLSRICREGIIIRLSRGVYLYPVIDKELGVMYPSVDKVAQAISERDKSRIIPTGLSALNILGLSAQIPMKVTYLTDGIPRKIKIGNQTINFKKTAPKNLAFQGKWMPLIVFALKEIGKDNIKDNDLKKIQQALSQENKEVILSDICLAPHWIREIILSLVNSTGNE
jgi:predicted transcriptional regulator of viral defense system